jgi:hypothetical protein
MKNLKETRESAIMLLSALLGALGSVVVMAQTEVDSVNAAGYIAVTVIPGFNIVTCPLITSPDNTIGTILNNANGALTGSDVYFWFPTANPAGYVQDSARNVGTSKGETVNTNGWFNNGTNVAAPGTAFWFENNTNVNLTLTFVGMVPTSPTTNSLISGFNLVGSVIPMSGDLCSNSISALTNFSVGDVVYTFDATNIPIYTAYISVSPSYKAGRSGYGGLWTLAGDPIIPNFGQGFWYENGTPGFTLEWVENYSVSQ